MRSSLVLSLTLVLGGTSQDLGLPHCWSEPFTYERCCLAGGDPDCWDHEHQPEVCCHYVQPKTCQRDCLQWDMWRNWLPLLTRWRVKSQSTQDSVLVALFGLLGITNAFYVEFGINDHDNAIQSNSRFLYESTVWMDACDQQFGPRQEFWSLEKGSGTVPKRWHGLLLDVKHSNPGINLHKEEVTWRSVVQIFRKYNVPLEPDYVSIDIDSCDLWVFFALTEVYRPRVLTVEYNAAYPLSNATVADCLRDPPRGSISVLKGGASLASLFLAARERGYIVVWLTCYLDVFLVREDLLCEGQGPRSLRDLEFFGECAGQRVQTEPFAADWNLDFAEWLQQHGRLPF
ncbi:unnamed protein product [Polarella glacialis]|uniref:Uncharacterized protein n=1 Tax=Polarella glacialis TaxID=89957 RepID=A0A813DGJ3_POLGL|nr:unnamed protein product [Polarella glacialis]